MSVEMDATASKPACWAYTYCHHGFSKHHPVRWTGRTTDFLSKATSWAWYLRGANACFLFCYIQWLPGRNACINAWTLWRRWWQRSKAMCSNSASSFTRQRRRSWSRTTSSWLALDLQVRAWFRGLGLGWGSLTPYSCVSVSGRRSLCSLALMPPRRPLEEASPMQLRSAKKQRNWCTLFNKIHPRSLSRSCSLFLLQRLKVHLKL